MIKLLSDTLAMWRKLAQHLVVPMLCAVLAVLIIIIDVSMDWKWLAEIIQATGRTLIQTLATLTIFILLFYVVTLLITQVVSFYWRNPKIYGVIMTIFLICLVVFNSFPILYYLYLFDEYLDLKNSSMALYSVMIGSLMFANGMLYYVFSHAMFEIIAETERLYIISAEYKNTNVADYIREKLAWIILSASGSIFYYLLSFTLFTDLFLDYVSIEESQMGVIGKLFIIIAETGWTTAAVVCLLSLLAIVLPIRLFVCQLPLWLWERRRLIDVQK